MSHHMNLSISEIHLLEAVGEASEDGEGPTVSELSERLRISPPSVTAAINKLVTKGYVEKEKSRKDGRMVHITLTKMGQKANLAHRYFHLRMVHSISKDLTEEEQAAMLKGMQKLNEFFCFKNSQETRRSYEFSNHWNRQRFAGLPEITNDDLSQPCRYERRVDH